MVLSSQVPRTVSRGRYMTSSRRRRRGPGLVALLLLVVGAAVAWAILSRDDDGAVDGDGTELVDGGARETGDSARRIESAPPTSATERTPPVVATGSPPPPLIEPPTITLGGSRALPGAGQPDGQPLRPAAGDAPVVVERPLPAPSSDEPTGARGDQRPAARSDTPRVATEEPAPSGVLQQALALSRRDPVEARRLLTVVATESGAPAAERARARQELNTINATLLLSPLVLPNDPLSTTYTVQSGDTLQRIARREGVDADWRLLMRINGITDERRVRVGQALKLVKGAFHAVVSKSEYRMDLFLGESADRVIVASFPVGLGEYNSTPTGRFRVRANSKLINPAWINPRTGERFAADDSKNPIGERWIGLEGIDDANRGVEGYGIHGTIEPDSIGRQASMGCVRMLAADVALVYELLTEPNSIVTIVD